MSDVLQYLANGWHPIPLCWPTPEGKCACGQNHSPRDVGKAPLTYWRDRTAINDVHIRRWHRQHGPTPNWGFLLHLSDLLVLDVDGLEGLAEVEELGIPDGVLSVDTGKGAHY